MPSAALLLLRDLELRRAVRHLVQIRAPRLDVRSVKELAGALVGVGWRDRVCAF